MSPHLPRQGSLGQHTILCVVKPDHISSSYYLIKTNESLSSIVSAGRGYGCHVETSRLTSGFLGESQTFIFGSEVVFCLFVYFLFICLLCGGEKGKQILDREMIQLVAV